MTHRSIIVAFVSLSMAFVARAEDVAVSYAISYDNEIKPIFRSHCLGCHNSQKKKGDLALDTYEAAMSGGASGEVVYAADLESSRLWALVNHDEQPSMPPESDKIPDAKLSLIRRWIEEGCAERSGTAKARPKKTALQFQPAAVTDRLSGAMPVDVCRQPAVVTARAAAVTALATSPRAPLLAVGGQSQVTLYDTQSSKLLGIIPYPEGTPQVIRFSRDGSLLLIAGGQGAQSGSVALHDVASGKRLIRLGDEIDTIMAADIDASLRYVAIGGPAKIVKVLSSGTGETIHEIKKHTDWITAVAFSPDGKFLATADRAGGLAVWEADTAREYQVFDGHKESITSLSWRDDSKVFATGSEDDTIRLWDPEKRKAIRSWGAHGGGVAAVRFNADGTVVSAGRDKRAKHWDAAGKQLRAFAPLEDIALSVCVSSDGKRVFAGDWTGGLRGYDMSADAPVATLAANPPTLQQRMAVMEQQVAPLTNQLAEIQRTHTSAVDKHNAARLDWQQAVQAFAGIQTAMNAASTSIDQFKSVLPSGEAENEADVQTQLDQLAEQLATLGNESQRLAEQTREKSKVLTQARQEQTQQADLLRTAETKLATQQASIEQLRREIESFDSRLPELESLVADSERQLSEMRNQLQQSQQQLADLQALTRKIEELEKAISMGEKKTEQSREEMDWLRQAYGPRN